MNKLIEAIVADATEDRLKNYDDAEKIAKEATERIVDVSEVTYMPIINKFTGEVVLVINPRDLATKTQYLINGMKDTPSSKFMAPYLEKKIIWSNEAQTAFTNGIRIAFSPIFGFQMYKKGMSYLQSINTKLAVQCMDSGADLAFEKNMAAGLYVRFVLTHEIYHMIYQHVRRSILYIKDPQDRELQYIANVAQDLEINRDIAARWPEYEKVITEEGFMWFKDERFKNKNTGKFFDFESWEEIYDYLVENRDQVPNLKKNPNANNPKQTNSKYPGGFKAGWDKAFNGIKNGKLNYQKATF